MGVIEINDLIFKYQDNLVFDNLNLSIKAGSFTTIIGNNGSGKSTLIKLLLGFEKSQGIYVFNKSLNDNIRVVRRKIGVVFENPASMFVCNTVEGELALSLKCLNLTGKQCQKRIKDVTKKLEIEDLLLENPLFLSKENQCLVALALCLVTDPNIIIIDDILSMISSDVALKTIKKLNKKGVTIINLTTNEEEILYGNNVIFIKDGKTVFSGTKAKLLKHLDVFDKCQIELPFVIDLSNKLIFYDLIDKRYTNIGTLVNSIWKS